MTRRRTGKERPDRLYGLAVAADDSAHVCLTQLHSEDRYLSRRNLGEHHLIGKLDELTDDEFEKLLHDCEAIRTLGFVIPPLKRRRWRALGLRNQVNSTERVGTRRTRLCLSFVIPENSPAF